MNDVCGVNFKSDGKIYYFMRNEIELNINDYVIVETEKGLQFGKILLFKNYEDINLDNVKSIIRKATEEDIEKFHKTKKEEYEITKKCKILVKEMNLNMSIIDSNYTFDKKQLLINFYADDRIDFRELAKKLASLYKTRIELRQIGARDKARQVSGVGVCGKILCCSKFLNHIDSITMNMAKNQNIALNPNKINGLCGRLLCCLSYENEEYLQCQKGMPNVGATVKTEYGLGKVVSIDILNRKYKVDIDGDIKEIELDLCEKSNK